MPSFVLILPDGTRIPMINVNPYSYQEIDGAKLPVYEVDPNQKALIWDEKTGEYILDKTAS
jgi:hypothetical protein